MSTTVVQERPDSADAVQLIAELDATLAPFYPMESRHGYSVDKLIREGVHFFVARSDNELAGCGGVQFFDTDYAELKRMYVRPIYRNIGLGKILVHHLEDYTREHGISILRLETGIYQEAAIRLYERMGFQRIPPFGDYQVDPVSLCYEKHLT